MNLHSEKRDPQLILIQLLVLLALPSPPPLLSVEWYNYELDLQSYDKQK